MHTLTTECRVLLGIKPGENTVYPLTPCCGAVAIDDSDLSTLVCETCTEAVGGYYGLCADLGSPEGIKALAQIVTRLGNCPCPHECALHTRYQIEQERERQ